jgi:hypothetical protein
LDKRFVATSALIIANKGAPAGKGMVMRISWHAVSREACKTDEILDADPSQW